MWSSQPKEARGGRRMGTRALWQRVDLVLLLGLAIAGLVSGGSDAVAAGDSSSAPAQWHQLSPRHRYAQCDHRARVARSIRLRIARRSPHTPLRSSPTQQGNRRTSTLTADGRRRGSAPRFRTDRVAPSTRGCSRRSQAYHLRPKPAVPETRGRAWKAAPGDGRWGAVSHRRTEVSS